MSKLVTHAFCRIAKWKRTAEEWFQRDLEMFENLLHTVRTNMVSLSRKGSDCVTRFLISGEYIIVRML